jgi:DNA ligase (NAD+)
MNIEGLGEGRIEVLYDNHLIKNSADLYDLKYEQLLGLEKIYDSEDGTTRKVSFREKTSQNIIESINISKAIPYPRVLFALGIRFVGETVAKKLAEAFPSVELLKSATKEQLIQVDEIGERIADSVVQYFEDQENLQALDRLITHGLQFNHEIKNSKISSVFEGKTFVISGVFEKFSRDEAKNLIEQHGGKVSGSISAKTSFVLAGDQMGPSKREKAEKLGVPLLEEDSFLTMINS